MMSTSKDTTKKPQSISHSCSSALCSPTKKRKSVFDDLSNSPQRPAQRRRPLKAPNDGSAAQPNTANAATSTNNRSSSSTNSTHGDNADAECLDDLHSSWLKREDARIPTPLSSLNNASLTDHLITSNGISVFRNLPSISVDNAGRSPSKNDYQIAIRELIALNQRKLQNYLSGKEENTTKDLLKIQKKIDKYIRTVGT